jgi:hypothetical protein
VDVSSSAFMHGSAALGLAGLLLGASCSAGPIDVIDNTLLRGLVAHWSFDETSGTALVDRSGNGHDGAVTGGTWSPGHFKGALHFEPGDSVAVPVFPAATPQWSVGLWVRPPAEDLGDKYITLISTESVFMGGWEMNARFSATDRLYQFGYYLGPGESDYFTYNCSCAVPEQWTHIMAVTDADAGTLTFYRDGLLQTPAATPPPNANPGPIKAGTKGLLLGRWQKPNSASDPRSFKGDLDDVVVYARVVTADEVAALARSAAPDR